VIRQLTPEERESRARALRGAVIDNEKREADQTTGGEGGTTASDGSPDSLRQREIEELRRIQEQEKSRRRHHPRRKARCRPRPHGGTRRRNGGREGSVLLKRGVIDEGEDEGGRRRKGGGAGRGAPAPRSTRGGQSRRAGAKITVTQALSADEGTSRQRSMASMRRRIERGKRQAMQQQEQIKIARDVTIPEAITVQELSNRMAERGADVIKVLMKMGVMATITQAIDADTAELVATELGHRVKRVTESDVESVLTSVVDAPESLKPVRRS